MSKPLKTEIPGRGAVVYAQHSAPDPAPKPGEVFKHTDGNWYLPAEENVFHPAICRSMPKCDVGDIPFAQICPTHNTELTPSVTHPAYQVCVDCVKEGN